MPKGFSKEKIYYISAFNVDSYIHLNCHIYLFCAFQDDFIIWRGVFEGPTPMEWGSPVHRSWLCGRLFISGECSLIIGCDESCDIS